MARRILNWQEGTPCWVTLGVDDVEEAARFYTRLLDWACYETDAGSPSLIAFRDAWPVAAIGPKPTACSPARWLTYLATDDVDMTAASVLMHGGRVHTAPYDVATLGRTVIAEAPDGSTFGMWQDADHDGVGHDEPGALAWNELQSNDLDAARAFYAGVFGYDYEDLTTPVHTYYTFKRTGEPDPIGGMGNNNMAPPGTASHWLAWFAVADTDQTADTAHEEGGRVLMPPVDGPSGRMAVVSGSQGEPFGVIDVADGWAPHDARSLRSGVPRT